MSTAAAAYELVDFGAGRKLERFGAYLLDRPSPAAEAALKQNPSAWHLAAARFERGAGEQGDWIPADALPERWTLDCGRFRLEIKPTPFGHLGVFPEQAENWEWLAARISHAGRPIKVLNLFAYTGGSTLAAAAAGAEVVHVDAAENTVAWARRNAELSGLAGAPIRWIAEDALKFARRERKRGNRYDAVILDPPSFGRGPKNETWKLERDLKELLALCGELTQERLALLVLTCHTPGYEADELRRLLAETLPAVPREELDARPLWLNDRAARRLPSGFVARCAVS